MANLIGANNRLFAEQQPGADATTFQVDNTSEGYFQSPYYLLHKDQLQPVPPPSVNPPRMNLADVLGNDFTTALQAAGQISFHAAGDTGAAKVTHLMKEESVADAMAADVQQGGATAPAFFFHLGDIIYYFGEGQYYYDQFYDPFRVYDRPIFAIPGNHDGIVYGDAGAGAPATLEAFLRNFCAAAAGPSPDAGGLTRSTMTQPGAYFTLDAPMVSIIGLYSNVLEGPGVISSQGGTYPAMGDEQLAFLQAELARLKPLRENGERAVILAVHHPPLSADAIHGGATGLSNDIDTACQAASLWPDAVLSGHAHLYQRFTRQVGNAMIPYVVSGSGGFNARTNPQEQTTLNPFPLPGGQAKLEKMPLIEYGYLTVTVDMTTAVKKLSISFRSPANGGFSDQVTIDLLRRQIVPQLATSAST